MPAKTSITEQEIAAAALDYQARGWHVIAIHGIRSDGTCYCALGNKCRSEGKHPVNGGWQSGAKPDGQAVDKMWKNRPGDNVGIATGDASGFFVLDIDVASGGLESMKALVAEHGTLPATLVVRTGGGGWHYYFKMPDFPVTNSAKGFPPGIDIRGTGGQVVAAPSVSAKGVYELKFDQPIAAAPAWMLELLRHDAPPAATPTLPTASALLDQTKREAAIEKSAVAGELKRLTDLTALGWDSLVGWDATTHQVACNLVELANCGRANLTMTEARGQFLEHCPPAEPGYEPEAKWDAGMATVGSKARVLVPTELHRDFMDAPNDQVRVDPRVGQPTAALAPPAAAGGGHGDPSRFFGDGGLLATVLAGEVMTLGPIRKGQDKAWWTYNAERGVWRCDPEAVNNRAVALLADRCRKSHATTAEMVVNAYAQDLIMDRPSTQWMNFANGMLDWRTGEMKAHGPEFESAVAFPMNFDPAATCPRFDAFLSQVMSPDYIRLAWEMIGYLLYSGNPLQKAFLFHGTGANGKGTLMRVIQEMLGEANTSTQSLDSLSNNRFSSSNLFGKIANLAGDIDGTFQESTAMFKMLTGEDRVSGEHKFGHSFTFNCWAVPVFSANKIPGSADVSVGYLRRWVVLEFDKSFEGAPILNLSDQLICEMSGIATKALSYLGPLLDRSRFDVSGDATKGAERFAMAIDQVREWVDECCMPAPGHRAKADYVYGRYLSWAMANGGGKLSAKVFYERLHAIGYPLKKVRGSRSVDGLMPIEQQVESHLESFLT